MKNTSSVVLQACEVETTLAPLNAESPRICVLNYWPFEASQYQPCDVPSSVACRRLRLKCDGTRAETRFRLSAKRMSPFKSAGASVQSTTGSRGVRISGSNAGYTMFRGSVKGTGYPLHTPVSPSLPNPCVTVCHHISTGLYTVQLRVSVWYEAVAAAVAKGKKKLNQLYHWKISARGGAVGWGTALQVWRSRLRFPRALLEFFIDIILLATLWPWGRLSL